MERQTGRWPADIPAEPEFPEALGYLWRWFIDLSSGRGGNGFGINPLSWTELRAWVQLTGHAPEPWEIDLLRRLDVRYLSAMLDGEKKS